MHKFSLITIVVTLLITDHCFASPMPQKADLGCFTVGKGNEYIFSVDGSEDPFWSWVLKSHIRRMSDNSVVCSGTIQDEGLNKGKGLALFLGGSNHQLPILIGITNSSGEFSFVIPKSLSPPYYLYLTGGVTVQRPKTQKEAHFLAFKGGYNIRDIRLAAESKTGRFSLIEQNTDS